MQGRERDIHVEGGEGEGERDINIVMKLLNAFV